MKQSSRLAALVLALGLSLSACAIHTRSQGIKYATAVEHALDSLQDAVRTACNAPIAAQVPLTPISACTPEAASYGLTTVKFRHISEGLAYAFDLEHDQLVPSLRLWNSGQPPPKEFSDFARLIDQVLASARTISPNQAYRFVLDAVQLVADELGRLGVVVGAYK